MANLAIEIEVPFVENTGRRCVPACTAMILGLLMPERTFTTKEIETLSGFQENRATWVAQHLLSLHDLGIEVGWIQDDNLPAFVDDPEKFMGLQIADEAELSKFKTTNDLELEAARIKQYLEKNLPFEKRPATAGDITTKLEQGWAVRLEVNGKTLADQVGYMAHAVVVSGFSDDVIRLENPDGQYGSKPKQIVTWKKLHEAWEEPILQYYRLPSAGD